MKIKQNVKVGISSCLLGENVRYDGGHKLAPFLRDTLGQFVEWAPVCPEVASGLPAPREAMHLIGDSGSSRIITIETGIDHTSRLVKWARRKVKLLEQERPCGFIFKSRSPSCAIDDAEIFAPTGTPLGKGPGIFAGVLMERFPFLPVEDEGRLRDPGIRENFIKRVFMYQRWLEFRDNGGEIGDLAAFRL